MPMQVLAFFGILAIVLVRIVHPPAEPVQPQVSSAARLAPEQRARAGMAVPPAKATADQGNDFDGAASPQSR